MLDNFIPLMRREWLQHRFAWALMVLVPLALAVLTLGVGTIDLGEDAIGRPPADLALMVGTVSLAVAMAALFLLLTVTSLFIAVGTPRRDDGDRSQEFWMSLPSGHAESLAAPVVVHLLLVPAGALLVGLVCALPVSMLSVGRVLGVAEWFGLPWGTLAPALGALVLRLVAGLPMALAWLAPLLLLAMLANALFRRWGLPVLGVALGMSSWIAQEFFGTRWPSEALLGLLRNAGLSLAGASGQGAMVSGGPDGVAAMAAVPGWAWRDWTAALAQLATPAFALALTCAVLLFTLLVQWRQRRGGLG